MPPATVAFLYMTKQSQQTEIALMAQDIKYITEAIGDFKAGYVEKTDFEPIKRIVYGLVSVILITVIGALLSGIIPSIRTR